jgi:hypothetical protein
LRFIVLLPWILVAAIAFAVSSLPWVLAASAAPGVAQAELENLAPSEPVEEREAPGEPGDDPTEEAGCSSGPYWGSVSWSASRHASVPAPRWLSPEPIPPPPRA